MRSIKETGIGLLVGLLVILLAHVVLAVGPVITVTPTRLTFTKDFGTMRVYQTVTVSNAGTGTMDWKVRSFANWLSVTPREGTNTGTFRVYAGVSGQPVGTYESYVEVSAIGAATVRIPIKLTVTGGEPIVEEPPDEQPLPPPGSTIDVPVGGNLQAVLDAATGGTTIRLVAGSTYWGPFVLRKNTGSTITITTKTTLPAAGTRISDSSNLATIQSANAEPAIRTEIGANNYEFVGVRFRENQGGNGEIVRLGNASDSNIANIPHHFTFDRVDFDIDPAIGQKRGIAANADYVTVKNSDIDGMWRLGQDSQAIAQWQARGHLVIHNNRLSAGSEIVMIGGSSTAVPGIIPADITIEGNYFTRPLSWQGDSKYVVKNLLELKSGIRVKVRGNLFENHWAAAQAGPAIVFTPKNSKRVLDVTFENNIVRNVGTGINILGYDYNAPYDRSQGPQIANVAIRNNLFILNRELYGGSGRFIMVSEGADNFTVANNTVVSEGAGTPNAFMYGYGDASGVTGWTVTDNIAFHGSYGVMAEGLTTGKPSIDSYFHPTFTGNVLYGASASKYPEGNSYPSVAAMMLEFVNPAAHDYRLKTGTYAGKGVNFSLLPQ